MNVLHQDSCELILSPCCHDRLSKIQEYSTRCLRCGASYALTEGVLDLRLDPSYDTLLDKEAYDRDHRVDPASASALIRVYERLLDKFTSPRQSFEEVLEIGSGTGNLTYGLASSERFRQVHCSDLSPEFICVLRDRMYELGAGGRIWYYLFDANQLPFAGSTMNLVAGHSVLHHLSRFERTLGEVHRVLSPGGIAIFGEPVLDMHVFVSLAARLILETDRSIAPRPFLGRRQIAALEVIADRVATKSRHLRLEDRESLRDVEDKFLVPVDYMRRLASELEFSDFEYSNPSGGVVDMGQLVRSRISAELERYEVDATALKNYAYVTESLDAVYGESMREHLTHLFGFYIFVK